MKLLVLILTVMAGTTFSLGAEASSKGEIWRLMDNIDLELRNGPSNVDDLELVAQHLKDALSVLRSGAQRPQECLDFSFEQYKKDGFSNGASMDKSKEYCGEVKIKGAEIRVLKEFFSLLKPDGYSNLTCLNLSLQIGERIAERDLPCVRSAHGKYRADGYSNRTSLEKAVNYCK